MCLAGTDTRRLLLKTKPNLHHIEDFQSKIEHSLIRDNLLVLHGLFGSDFTSAFFGHPSYNSLSMKWEHLARKLAVFRESNATLNEVHDVGVKLISAMYRCDVNLNLERARMFKERCNDKAKKKKINIEWLPLGSGRNFGSAKFCRNFCHSTSCSLTIYGYKADRLCNSLQQIVFSVTAKFHNTYLDNSVLRCKTFGLLRGRILYSYFDFIVLANSYMLRLRFFET